MRVKEFFEEVEQIKYLLDNGLIDLTDKKSLINDDDERMNFKYLEACHWDGKTWNVVE